MLRFANDRAISKRNARPLKTFHGNSRALKLPRNNRCSLFPVHSQKMPNSRVAGKQQHSPGPPWQAPTTHQTLIAGDDHADACSARSPVRAF